MALFLMAETGMATEGTPIPPDDPRIGYSDFIHLDQSSDPLSPTGKTARFDRLLDMPGKGYRWDNPGTRMRLRTDAASLEIFLYYSERHISTSARNAIGRYWIDGQSKPEWTFGPPSASSQREPKALSLRLSSSMPGFHTYEIVLPYGDSVEIQGLRLPPESRLEESEARTALRYIAYGDSITQGFTASEEARTYPFLLAEQKNWQLHNMGFGGRASTPSDGAVIASLTPDIVTVLIGVNDWQAGIPVATYRAHMEGFLSGLREREPNVPIYLLTPLWVPPSWKPEKAVADLEEYRQALRDMATAHPDSNLHLVEGPALIDHDPSLFNSVAVHPNDQGFAQMAERLAKATSSDK